MSRSRDDGDSARSPDARARRRSWRMLLSAVAGGGLTAISLGGPLAAANAETATGTTSSTEGAAPPTTSTAQTPPEAPSESTTTSTQTTSTETTSTSTASSETTSIPAPPPPTTGTQTTGGQRTGTQGSGKSGNGAPTAGKSPGSGKGPTVVLRRKQNQSANTPATRKSASTSKPGSTQSQAQSHAPSSSKPSKSATPAAGAPNNVALSPQLVAGQANALAAALAGSAVSAQALDFYRIPLFLLPIYRAAAAQYDVPWQILAAINEIETNYGTDLSVSSAGAVGWMQFMPETWLQYGVDALNAGYADPYNPVDAIFAAARYLNAAGAATNLNAAILAYNHSDAYLSSVLLRAKLIAAYPNQVIATLTGLVDGRLPVTGKGVRWSAPASVASPQLPSSSSATAGASATSAAGTPASAAPGEGVASAPTPARAASAASGSGTSPLMVELTSEPNASAVAVQDGRVVKIGSSPKLGKYVVLQDVYGDVFTYAGLGTVAPTYLPPKAQLSADASLQASGAPAHAGSGSAGGAAQPSGSATAGTGKVRVYAHPGNPDASAAARAKPTPRTSKPAAGGRQPLRSGSVVPQGSVLGQVSTSAEASEGHLRFSVKPAGDPSTIDPRAILENWSQLGAALHPQGAKGNNSLLGATASDVFMLSKSQLERSVLSDPGIAMSACSRQEVASGRIDKRLLATLAFLSRSGLKPTVGTLACGSGAYAAAGYVAAGHDGDAAAIVAINGVPIAGHQGAGSITDTTIRTLLTLQHEYFPARIVSLMRYPGAPTTQARADHGDYIEVVFAPAPQRPHQAHAAAAHSAGAGPTAPAPGAAPGGLGAAEWRQLFSRVAGLPVPQIALTPSSAAIPDRKSGG
jgi:soluble lytic murein transglycosylase-like protein